MRVTIFGSTGKLGRALLEEALAAGHDVVAYARDPARLGVTHARLRVEKGDLADEDAIARAITGADAVLAGLGGAEAEALLAGIRRILDAMKAKGVRRVVAISGSALDLPGDEKGTSDKLMGWIVRTVAKGLTAEKIGEHALLRDSGLDWTIVRPSRIVEGPATGKAKLHERTPPGSSVPYGDVARFMVAAAADPAWVGKAPFIAA